MDCVEWLPGLRALNGCAALGAARAGAAGALDLRGTEAGGALGRLLTGSAATLTALDLR